MLKILLIDDEEEVLDVVSLVLKTMGYYVVKARDGKEGIRRFDELSFDVVVTDLNMPLCNGDEVAKHIRKTDGNIQIICITGTPEDVDNSYFDIVLKKPFSFKKLVEYIKTIENRREILNKS
jgi:DNA-binding response OmpR family regulator